MSKPTETELLPERMTLDSIPQAVYHVVRWYSETFERVPLKEEFEGIEAVLRQHFAPQPTLQQAILSDYECTVLREYIDRIERHVLLAAAFIPDHKDALRHSDEEKAVLIKIDGDRQTP